MKIILAGKGLTKSYGYGEEKQKVLDEVSIEIGQGEFVSIMGPSGSGKSTLLYALSSMDQTDAGKVTFAGRDIAAMKENELADLRRTKMGFVFQQPTMIKNLNILDNIILPSMRGNRKKRTAIVARALDLMKKTGIADLGQRAITQVSGGQLQRAGICRALMCEPQIIFGDEPTGALNSAAAAEIMDILRAINRDGTAILLVTHDVKVAARTKRVLFMRDGRLHNEFYPSQFKGLDLEKELVALGN